MSHALPRRRALAYHASDMTDAALLAARWAHSIAAVAWVGGGLFYLLVLQPAVRSGALSSDNVRTAAERFGGLVKLAMWTLVVTGAVLFFTRISEPTATARYAAVLALKVALSAWMFFIAITPPQAHRGCRCRPARTHPRRRRRARPRQHGRHPGRRRLPAVGRAALHRRAGTGRVRPGISALTGESKQGHQHAQSARRPKRGRRPSPSHVLRSKRRSSEWGVPSLAETTLSWSSGLPSPVQS